MSSTASQSTSADRSAPPVRPAPDTRFRTKDVTDTKGQEFEEYGLKDDLLRGIYGMDFERPTPVQEEVIPVAMTGKSVLARAKNGTGKTGAFCVPLLQAINTDDMTIQGLVLLPTRELALQTSRTLIKMGEYMPGLKVMVATGGTKVREDVLRLEQKVHVLVGTIGRVAQLCQERAARLNNLKMLVLDEADRLLSEDSVDTVEKIIRFTPRRRQMMLLSATFPGPVKEFCDRHLPDCAMVNLMSELTLFGVSQFYAALEERQKIHALHTLYGKLKINQSIVFCNTNHRVDLLARFMAEKLGFSCLAIHSHMEQDERNRVFHNFRAGEARHLVCSDIFTRGIDVQAVNVVFNFDFPSKTETYLHRVGRAGRYGHLGIAINFITNRDIENLTVIERELGTEILPIPNDIDEQLYNK